MGAARIPDNHEWTLEAVTLISSGHSGKQIHKIAGGNDQLPKAFATRLADKINGQVARRDS